MSKHFEVTNTSKQAVTRLGVTVPPGETRIITAEHPKQELAIRAPRAFEIEQIEDPDEEPEGSDGDNDDESNDDGQAAGSIEPDAGDEEDDELPIEEDPEVVDPLEAATGVESPTIPDVMEAVNAGEISAADALAAEEAGKERSTLVEQLQSLVEG